MTTANYPSVYLRKGRDEAVRRFHPWIFSGAIERIEGQANEGDPVRLFAHDGTLLGCGFFEGGSIAVRMLSFGTSITDFDAFFVEKIEQAYRLRQALGLIQPAPEAGAHRNNVYRLVHGEGDGVSGLVIDVYGDTAVLQAHSTGVYHHIERIAEAVVKVCKGEVTAVFDKSSATLPDPSIASVGDRFLIGKSTAQPVYENGLQILPDWLRGQKTGFFIDQRDNRRLVGQYASGRRVLNMFCYSGGFSLYALQGGAEEVVSVDSSARALSLVEHNVALNFGDTIAGGRHEGVVADAFEYLKGIAYGAFDLIVLDPPAFAKKRSALKNALNGYRKLNALALERLAPGSFLFTYSCSQAVSPEDFRLAVLTASVQAGRSVRILQQLGQATDHPVSIYHPEGEYLKGLFLYVE
ncbi:SAM-dependent methyltransferase [Porphyromonas gingivicanis]|uniref:SAM-dependent methyltransferase n=1 Tax=Porphyromonas gingivicanis TaxID=266762 RepID=A0A0A2G7F2_9PORP|nr:class I SAM-dependent rRNA methyltransferase [Porphyromonas gingivicanis]KGN99201.1 SAM-dependent methyltransferase [Porphyromonas gingivicanis]